LRPPQTGLPGTDAARRFILLSNIETRGFNAHAMQLVSLADAAHAPTIQTT
jgi:hypothetical protein